MRAEKIGERIKGRVKTGERRVERGKLRGERIYGSENRGENRGDRG